MERTKAGIRLPVACKVQRRGWREANHKPPQVEASGLRVEGGVNRRGKSKRAKGKKEKGK